MAIHPPSPINVVKLIFQSHRADESSKKSIRIIFESKITLRFNMELALLFKVPYETIVSVPLGYYPNLKFSVDLPEIKYGTAIETNREKIQSLLQNQQLGDNYKAIEINLIL